MIRKNVIYFLRSIAVNEPETYRGIFSLRVQCGQETDRYTASDLLFWTDRHRRQYNVYADDSLISVPRYEGSR